MNIIKYKEQIIEEIKNEIKEKETKLTLTNPEDRLFDEILNELEILRYELDIIKNLKEENQEKTIENIKQILKNYSYIVNLPKEKVIEITEYIDAYNIAKETSDLNFDETKMLDEAIIKEFDLNNGNISIEKLNFTIKEMIKKIDKIQKNYDATLKRISIIDFNSYNTLFQNIKNGFITELDVIRKFSKLGNDTLINSITGAHIRYKTYQKKSKKPNYDHIKKLRERILFLEKKLMEYINEYIEYSVNKSEVTSINKSDYDKINFTAMCITLPDLIKEELDKYIQFINECNKIKIVLLATERFLNQQLLKIEPNEEIVTKILSNKQEINKTKISKILARKNLMTRIVKLEKKEQETILKKVEGYKNDKN